MFDEALIINDGTPIDVKMTAATGERHDGTAGTGVRFVRTTTSSMVYLSTTIQKIVEWIEFDGNDLGATCVGQNTGVHTSDRTKQVLRNLICHIGTTATRFPQLIDSAVRPMTVQNCFAYGAISTGSGGSTISYGIGGDDKMDILNCTVQNIQYNNSTGAVHGIAPQNSTNAVAKNNLVTDVSSTGAATVEDYLGSLTNATTATNGSEDLTGDTTGLSAANLFVSTVIGSEDLHLKSGADAIDAGTDLGTTPSGVEIDIDGSDRDSLGVTWDMGAHEFIASGGGPSGNPWNYYAQGA